MAHRKKDRPPHAFEPGTRSGSSPAWRTPTSPTSPWAAGRGRSRWSSRWTTRSPTRSSGTGGPSTACTRSTRTAASGTGSTRRPCGSARRTSKPDDGTPVPIEQPTEIRTPPLSEKDQDDRVRKALGLTHDDPLPEISHETLSAYYRYLAAHLKFPFAAIRGEVEIGPYSRKRATMTVTGLLDPDERGGLSVEDGLVCTGRDRDEEIEFPLCDIEVKKKDPNFKLVSDYAYWFHNWPCRDEGDTARGVRRGRGTGGTATGLCGSSPRRSSSAASGVVSWGRRSGRPSGRGTVPGLAAMIGGVPLGMIGAFLLGRYGSLFGAVNRLRYGPLLGAASGLVGGGLVGVVAGLTVVSLPWSLVGLIVGMFSGPYVLPQERRRLISLRAASLGTCGGILVSAFRHDRARATSGAVPGLITGLLVAAGLVLLLVGAVYLMPGSPTGSDDTDGEDDEFEGVEEGGDGLHLRRS